jgi:hypothetical protein
MRLQLNVCSANLQASRQLALPESPFSRSGTAGTARSRDRPEARRSCRGFPPAATSAASRPKWLAHEPRSASSTRPPAPIVACCQRPSATPRRCFADWRSGSATSVSRCDSRSLGCNSARRRYRPTSSTLGTEVPQAECPPADRVVHRARVDRVAVNVVVDVAAAGVNHLDLAGDRKVLHRTPTAAIRGRQRRCRPAPRRAPRLLRHDTSASRLDGRADIRRPRHHREPSRPPDSPPGGLNNPGSPARHRAAPERRPCACVLAPTAATMVSA